MLGFVRMGKAVLNCCSLLSCCVAWGWGSPLSLGRGSQAQDGGCLTLCAPYHGQHGPSSARSGVRRGPGTLQGWKCPMWV